MDARPPVGESGVPALPPLPLIGRDTEVRLAQDLFCQRSVQLLTLWGPGGTGKTRLALELAHHLGPQFAQGIRWIDLAELRDAASVWEAVAVIVRASGPTVDEIATAIGSLSLLLVLDNFEHLLDAAPKLGGLVQALPELRVLVTSRTVLHLRCEHELFVAPLSLEAPSSGVSDAEVLFERCAQVVDPRFSIDQTNQADVRRICILLDGIPLAIELAAARLRAVPPAGLLAWLGRPLEVLTDGPSDGPHHGRSLRDAVRWSYDLLSSEEQQVFTACAVFAGGFALPALAAVTGSAHPMALVIGLVEDSLLHPTAPAQHEDTDLEARWRLLEPLRDFATERLENSQDAATLRQRHAEFYLRLAEHARPERELFSPETQARLQADDANLSAALDWLVQSGQAPDALRLILALGPYWEGCSRHRAELDWCIRALALPTAPQHPKLRADVLCAQAYCEQYLQRLTTTRETLGEALHLYETLGDATGRTQALRILVSVHSGLDQYPEALSLLETLRTRFEAEGDAYLMCETLHNTAVVHLRMNQSAQALPLLERAQPLAVQTHYDNGLGFVLMLRVWAGYLGGVRTAPLPLLEEAWRVNDELQVPDLRATMLLLLASYARESGNYAFSARLFSLANHVHAPLGHPWTSCFVPQVHRLDTELRALLGGRYDRECTAGIRLGLGGLRPEVDAWLKGAAGQEKSGRAPDEPDLVLTSREQEVLRCVAQGCSDKRTAQLLSISPGTVSKHVTHVLAKLGLHNRVELSLWATRQGLKETVDASQVP